MEAFDYDDVTENTRMQPRRGSYHPLTPQKLAKSPESRLNARLDRLGLVKLNRETGGRCASAEYVESCRLFALATAKPGERVRPVSFDCGDDKLITTASFLGLMACRGMAPHRARAAFDTFDLDRSGRLNPHEFALLRYALITHRGVDAEMSVLLQRYEQLALLGRDAVSTEESDAAAVLAALPDRNMRPAPALVLDPRMLKHVAADRARRASMRMERYSAAPLGYKHSGPKPPSSLKKPMRQTSAPVRAPGVVDAFQLDDELRVPEGSDWRGAIAATRKTAEFLTAEAVVEEAQKMAARVVDQSDVVDRDWIPEATIVERLLRNERGDASSAARRIIRLCRDVQRVATSQPTVVNVASPAKVFGDIHGQLRDALMLFGAFGFPSHRRGGDVDTCAYVFNGDWVDRGAHQLSVVITLFALKVLYPARIVLVRGNHEFRSQSEQMGESGFRHMLLHTLLPTVFDGDCALAEEVYEAVHDAFDMLPLAAVIDRKALVIHGGIGEWTLDDLRRVRRPLRELWSSEDGSVLIPVALEAVWNDPTGSDADMASGVHRNDRDMRAGDVKEFTKGPFFFLLFAHSILFAHLFFCFFWVRKPSRRASARARGFSSSCARTSTCRRGCASCTAATSSPSLARATTMARITMPRCSSLPSTSKVPFACGQSASARCTSNGVRCGLLTSYEYEY